MQEICILYSFPHLLFLRHNMRCHPVPLLAWCARFLDRGVLRSVDRLGASRRPDAAFLLVQAVGVGSFAGPKSCRRAFDSAFDPGARVPVGLLDLFLLCCRPVAAACGSSLACFTAGFLHAVPLGLLRTRRFLWICAPQRLFGLISFSFTAYAFSRPGFI